MKNWTHAAILGAGILMAQGARANDRMVVNLSLFYFDEAAVRSVEATPNDYSVKSKSTYTFASLGLCYSFSNFCVGAKYLQNDIESKASASNNSNAATKSVTRFKGPGLSLGYAGESFFAQGVWMVGADKSVDHMNVNVYGSNQTTSVRYPAKKATLIEVGYGFKLESVRVGPMLSLINFSYDKVRFSGKTIDLPKTESDDFIVPQVALWVDI